MKSATGLRQAFPSAGEKHGLLMGCDIFPFQTNLRDDFCGPARMPARYSEKMLDEVYRCDLLFPSLFGLLG